MTIWEKQSATNPGFGGNYKNSDNIIAEEMLDGTKLVRFQPVSAWETPEAVEMLCNEFNEALKDPDIDQLLLMPVFILDFLCIHPFDDGNGRMSRLLTLLILYRSGYIVGKYISLEKLIADHKESYYEACGIFLCRWHLPERRSTPGALSPPVPEHGGCSPPPASAVFPLRQWDAPASVHIRRSAFP